MTEKDLSQKSKQLDNFEAALTNIVEELPDTKYSTMANGILRAIDNGFIPDMPTETLIDRLKHYGYNGYGEELEYAYSHLSERRQARISKSKLEESDDRNVLEKLKSIFNDCKARFGFNAPVKAWPSLELRDAISSLGAAEDYLELNDALEQLDDVAKQFADSPDEDVAAFSTKIWNVIAEARQDFKESTKTRCKQALYEVFGKNQMHRSSR